MSYKEWTATVQVVGVAIMAIWLAMDISAGGAGLGMAAQAMKLIWAIGAAIVFNIVAIIVVTILVSIARREQLKDEQEDERDRAVTGKSYRNAYVVMSVLCALSLVALAFGADPSLALYALFVAAFLGGATDALSRLIYYRIG